VHGAELKRLAAAAVAGLPPKRREVFRLVREEGLSYKEVAEALGLSPQTVANHMSLALADLRATLRPYLPVQDSSDAEGSAEGPDQNSSRS
jgi:RNA polymerase sigma-70 factor (ECF subfamily)